MREFGAGGGESFFPCGRGQADEAIVIAKDEIARVYGDATKGDRAHDRALIGARWATRGDVTGKDCEIIPLAKGAGVAHCTIDDHTCDAFVAQMARKDIADHGVVAMGAGGNDQNLAFANEIKRMEHGPEIRRGAIYCDGAADQPGLPARRAQGADIGVDLARAGDGVDSDGDRDIGPSGKIGCRGKRGAVQRDRHGAGFHIWDLRQRPRDSIP